MKRYLSYFAVALLGAAVGVTIAGSVFMRSLRTTIPSHIATLEEGQEHSCMLSLAALTRLDAGKYGYCFDCAQEISEQRLRALPFAARCQSCEERREEKEAARMAEQRRAPMPNTMES